MKKIFWLGFTVVLFFTGGCNAQNSPQSADAIKIVHAFQHLSDDDLQCFDEKCGAHGKWTPLKNHVSRLLSPDLLRSYKKACETDHRMFEPRFNDHLKNKTDDDMLLRSIKNTHYIVTSSHKTRTAIRVNYDHNACSHQECGNYTEYTLILIADQWLIDDMSIGLKPNHMGDSSWRENYSSLKAELNTIANSALKK